MQAAQLFDRGELGGVERGAVDHQDVERVEPVGALDDLRGAADRARDAIAAGVAHEPREMREPRCVFGSDEDVDHGR